MGAELTDRGRISDRPVELRPAVVALVALGHDNEPVGYAAASLVADVAELQRLAVTTRLAAA